MRKGEESKECKEVANHVKANGTGKNKYLVKKISLETLKMFSRIILQDEMTEN